MTTLMAMPPNWEELVANGQPMPEFWDPATGQPITPGGVTSGGFYNGGGINPGGMYTDPGMAYPGGSPHFDERTGKYVSGPNAELQNEVMPSNEAGPSPYPDPNLYPYDPGIGALEDPPTWSTVNTSQQTNAPWQALYDPATGEGMLSDALGGVQAGMETPWTSYQGDWVADFDPAQSEALTGQENYATGGQQNLGKQFNRAGKNLMSNFGTAQSTFEGVANAAPVQNEGVDLDTVARIADNPYVTGMVDASTRDVTRNLYENQLPGIAAYSAGTGNLGSSRRGVQEAIATRGAADRIADVGANLRGRLYESALGKEYSRASQNAGLKLSGRGQQLQAGQGLANLGQAGANLRLTGNDIRRQAYQDQYDAGQTRQLQEQAETDALRQQHDMDQRLPFEQAGTALNMLTPLAAAYGTSSAQNVQELSEEQAALNALANAPIDFGNMFEGFLPEGFLGGDIGSGNTGVAGDVAGGAGGTGTGGAGGSGGAGGAGGDAEGGDATALGGSATGEGAGVGQQAADAIGRAVASGSRDAAKSILLGAGLGAVAGVILDKWFGEGEGGEQEPSEGENPPAGSGEEPNEETPPTGGEDPVAEEPPVTGGDDMDDRPRQHQGANPESPIFSPSTGGTVDQPTDDAGIVTSDKSIVYRDDFPNVSPEIWQQVLGSVYGEYEEAGQFPGRGTIEFILEGLMNPEEPAAEEPAEETAEEETADPQYSEAAQAAATLYQERYGDTATPERLNEIQNIYDAAVEAGLDPEAVLENKMLEWHQPDPVANDGGMGVSSAPPPATQTPPMAYSNDNPTYGEAVFGDTLLGPEVGLPPDFGQPPAEPATPITMDPGAVPGASVNDGMPPLGLNPTDLEIQNRLGAADVLSDTVAARDAYYDQLQYGQPTGEGSGYTRSVTDPMVLKSIAEQNPAAAAAQLANNGFDQWPQSEQDMMFQHIGITREQYELLKGSTDESPDAWQPTQLYGSY